MTNPPPTDSPAGARISTRGPAGAILRYEDAPFWVDGKGYLESAKTFVAEAKAASAAAAEVEKQRGYQDGFKDGAKAAVELVAKTKAAVDEYQAKLSVTLTELVIAILKDALGEIDASQIIALSVRKAIKGIDLSPDMTVTVTPGLLNDVHRRLSASEDRDILSVLNFKEDSRLPPNSCRIVSEFGTIDLSTDRQISILIDSLRAAGVGMGKATA